MTSWEAAFCAGAKEPAPSARELRTLKDELAKLKRELGRKDKALAEAAALLVLQKKVPGVVGGRGKITAVPQRQNVMALVAEAVDAGARQEQACAAIDLSERTLQRWQDDARTAVATAARHGFTSP